MQNYIDSLTKEDKTTWTLSALYESFGYRKYRNAKFEEYSFYHDFQGFLGSGGVITFNDAKGRLMALKPDMTLSILKNVDISQRNFARIYYNENVYRYRANVREYDEIHQCGLEMMGPIDGYAVGEVVLLALKSLQTIDSDFVLTLSHADLVAAAIRGLPVTAAVRDRMAALIRRKNRHDLRALCERENIRTDRMAALLELAEIYGPLSTQIAALERLGAKLFAPGDGRRADYLLAVEELAALHRLFADTPYATHLQLDTSVINPVDYYSGIVMQGYVRAVPYLVLAGGRYDRLSTQIREGIGAVGFAVYLDTLPVYYPKKRDFDVDVLILYPEEGGEQGDSLVLKKMQEILASGQTVRVEPKIPVALRARKMLRRVNGDWEEIHA